MERFVEFAQTQPPEAVRPLLPTILTLIQRAAPYPPLYPLLANLIVALHPWPHRWLVSLSGLAADPAERQMLWRKGARLLQEMDALAWLDDNPHHPPFIGMFH